MNSADQPRERRNHDFFRRGAAFGEASRGVAVGLGLHAEAVVPEDHHQGSRLQPLEVGGDPLSDLVGDGLETARGGAGAGLCEARSDDVQPEG